MGKEWHLRGRTSRRAAAADVHRNNPSSPIPGCMSAVFHFFDFHSSHFTPHFLFTKHHHHHHPRPPPPSSLSDLSHLPKLPPSRGIGVEAPRNSLELDEPSISSLRKEDNLHTLMGLQIKTSRNGGKKSKASKKQQLPNNNIASESPSARTPNLLARLMGLDILPQTSSPSSSSRHLPRSLPASPRASSHRLSDVDRHHRRLSLQLSLHKDNAGAGEGIEQEIIERVRKKVALVDITNKLEFGEQEVVFSRSNKTEKSSKRLRNQEVVSDIQKPTPMAMAKAKPREEEAFGCPSLTLRKAIEKTDKKSCEKAPMSNNLMSRPTVFPVKKDPSPPAPAAKIPREQPCSYPKGKHKQPAREGGERNAVICTTTADGGAAEIKYIKSILSSNGVLMDTPVSFPRWFSPSNPLDPSTFHYLETTADAVEEPMRHRCNRRLLFHLVDELLAEILGTEIKKKKKNGKKKPWESSTWMEGWELVEKVREKVEEFPRANCQVLEDIDGLIDKDLQKTKLQMSTAMAETTEGIVKVVELDILDSLLRETAAIASMGSYGDGVVL